MPTSLQLVTAVAAVLFAGCGGPRFATEQSVAPGYRASSDEHIALFPLIVGKAEISQHAVTVGVLAKTYWNWRTPMSVAEYRPAANIVDDRLARALAPADPVRGATVEASLAELNPASLVDAVRGVAASTNTASVLVIEVDDFKAVLPSSSLFDPTGASSSALVNASLYSATGEVRWTISSRILLECAMATKTPPSLAELMEIAMTGFVPTIRGLQDPQGPRTDAAPRRLDGQCKLR